MPKAMRSGKVSFKVWLTLSVVKWSAELPKEVFISQRGCGKVCQKFGRVGREHSCREQWRSLVSIL